MTFTITPAGFVAIDKDNIAIQATGNTPEEALATAIADCGPLFDQDGETLSDAAAAEQFTVLPATAALMAQVEAKGGAITWDKIDGTACTVEEEAE